MKYNMKTLKQSLHSRIQFLIAEGKAIHTNRKPSELPQTTGSGLSTKTKVKVDGTVIKFPSST